jgi:hypothetical protein
MRSRILAATYIFIFLASSIFIAISLIKGDAYIRQHLVMLMIACLSILSIIATIQFFFSGQKDLFGDQKERIAPGIHIVLFLWSIPAVVTWCFWPCWPWFGELRHWQQLMNSGNPIYLFIILIAVILILGFSLIVDWIIVSMVVGFILRAFMSKQEARVYFQKIQDQRSGLNVMDWIVTKMTRFYFWLLERIWR